VALFALFGMAQHDIVRADRQGQIADRRRTDSRSVKSRVRPPLRIRRDRPLGTATTTSVSVLDRTLTLRNGAIA
jgi:hypothetical protein